MTSLSKKTASVPVMAGAPNPQGKGQVGFLQDWARSRPRSVVAKRPAQLLADYFTSLLVLSSAFSFKPVVGQTYYLYLAAGRWKLSLVSPDEWNDELKRLQFVGACSLHDDLTWSIEPSDNLGRPGPIAEALATVYEGFVERLNSKTSLEAGLPEYEGRLPYYQRLFASALGQSLRGSLSAGSQTGRTGEAWLQSLPRDAEHVLRALTDGADPAASDS